MKKEMSETLVRTGPGTRMGNLLRRYWVPILLSREIAEPDGPQVRVQILGEKLLAFRSTDGEPGLISEFCSHRGASLYLGRNEENGIRCSYHGLKFDRLGNCVDVPSAPQACATMGIRGYPCIERAGIVWAYMGPKEKEPPPPGVEWCNLPASHVFVSKRLQECSYLQAMEGGIDTSHVTYVHPFGDHALGGHVWVPIDDHNCWAWSINFHPNKPLSADERRNMEEGKGIHCPYEPGTFRPIANKDNDYLMDRAAQKDLRSYSGVFGFAAQDASLQESMGQIQDHENEKLLPTDRAIVMARRFLYDAALALEKGEEPPALDADRQRVRAAGVLLERSLKPQGWAKDHLADALNQAVYSL